MGIFRSIDMNLWDWFSDDINWSSDSGDWTDQWGDDSPDVVSWSPSTGYTGSDSAMAEAYLNTGDTSFLNWNNISEDTPFGAPGTTVYESLPDDTRSLARKGKDALFGKSGLNLTSKTIESISRFALGAQGFTKKQSRQGGQGRASRRSRSGKLSGPVGRGGSGAFKAGQTSSQLIANMIAQSQRGSNAANALSDRAYREAARELNMAIVQAISGEGKAAGPNITGKAPTISITSKVT